MFSGRKKKTTTVFPVHFLIDISVYGDLAAKHLLAIQPRVMNQFTSVVGLSHGAQVSENCKICHRGRSHPLLGSQVIQPSSLAAVPGHACWDSPSQHLLLDDPDFDLALSPGFCLILRILSLHRISIGSLFCLLCMKY